MAVTLAVILFTIISQAICAPSGCLDLCNQPADNLNIQTSESLTQQSSALRRLELEAARGNLDYNRPGNWTEHNDYATDNGAGQVHEEKGQFVNGPAQVRYYKKNYSSSYRSVPSINHSELRNIDNVLLHHDGHVDNSQSTIDTNQQNYYRQHSAYNEQNSQHHSTTNLNSHSARLEDLSENIQGHGNTGTVGVIGTDNWSRHNTYGTDGGRGKVYEEQGVYTNGPAKVHYYKKNYTSSYSSGSAIPVGSLPTIPDLTPDITSQLQQLQTRLDEFGREVQQSSQIAQHVHTDNVHRNVNGGNYQHYDYNHGDAGHISGIRNQQEEHSVTRNHHVVPNIHRETSQTHHEETQQETYVPSSQRISHANYHHESQQHHETQQHQVNENLTPVVSQHYQRNNHNNHNQEISSGYVVQPGVERHVEEHWSSSKHQSGYTMPRRTVTSHAADALTQQQYGIHHSHGDYNNANLQNANRYISSDSSTYHQQHGTGSTGHFHTGTIDLGHNAADCEGSARAEYRTQLPRRYKRDLVSRDKDLAQQTEDLTQQTEDLTQQTHNHESYTQQQQQQPGGHEFQQQNQHHRHHTHHHEHRQQDTYGQHGTEDFTQQQQHTGGLEFGQHTQSQGRGQYSQQAEDLTQQTEGFDDYYQKHSTNLESNQQNQQQASGIEFGHQTQGRDHGQYTQQTEDLTQQTQGHGDYHQQHLGNSQLNQQHQQGELEFGQHTRDHGHGQYTQQTEDLTQQTQGYGDYYQQHLGNSQLNQQHEQGELEFGQQSQNHGHGQYTQQTEDLTQQTQGYGDYHQQHSGNLELNQQHQQSELEFGQHTQQNYGRDFTQQNQQNYQQNGFEQQHGQDFTQQTSHIDQNDHGFDSRPAPKPTPRSQRVGNLERGDIEITHDRPVGVKGGRPRLSQQQAYSQQSDQSQTDSQGVVSLEEQVQQTQNSDNPLHTQQSQDLTSSNYQDLQRRDQPYTTGKASQIEADKINFQPRILEAYGGAGVYDADHNENIFSGVKPNPSATLEPNIYGRDPWDIRDISSDDISVKHVPTVASAPESSANLPYDSNTTQAPGFWKRVGQKITGAYDKAKAKVTDAFG